MTFVTFIQRCTLEGSRVAAAIPQFCWWLGGPLALKYLHHNNCTTYKNIKNNIEQVYAIAIGLLANIEVTDSICYPYSF